MPEGNGFYKPDDFNFEENDVKASNELDEKKEEQTFFVAENHMNGSDSLDENKSDASEDTNTEEKTIDSDLEVFEGKKAADHMSEEDAKAFSDKLHDSSETTIIKGTVIDNPKDRVIIRFKAPEKNIFCDIDVPLDISANDLVLGLNEAFHLGVDISDMKQCYLSSENPIALIKGKKLLGEFGVRDGTLIVFSR